MAEYVRSKRRDDAMGARWACGVRSPSGRGRCACGRDSGRCERLRGDVMRAMRSWIMFTLSAYEIAGGDVDVGCDRASGARGQRRWLSERARGALALD